MSLKQITLNRNNPIIQKAITFHQNVYELSCDWNIYEVSEHSYLKDYITYALFGLSELKEKNISLKNFKLYDICKDKKIVDDIYDKMVKYGSEFSKNKEIFCNIVYNIIFTDSNKQCNTFYPMPIFKLKKILCKYRNEFEIWYIDSEGRVYKHWNLYLKNNSLSDCIMIYPKEGIYQANFNEAISEESSIVWIEFAEYKKHTHLTKALNTTSNTLSVCSLAVGITAFFSPVIVPLATAATIGGCISAMYEAKRAVKVLHDRKKHDQSINIIDNNASKAWVSLAVNSFGVAANGASSLLNKAIKTGTNVNKASQLIHNTIIIGNLISRSGEFVFSTVNIINKFKKTGKIEKMDLATLALNTLLFYNSVVSLQLAENIIRNNQSEILMNHEKSLRTNKHKREFRRKLRKLSAKTSNTIEANEIMIRRLNKIKTKNDFNVQMVQRQNIPRTVICNMEYSKNFIMQIHYLLLKSDFVKKFCKNVKLSVTQVLSIFLITCKPLIELLQKDFETQQLILEIVECIILSIVDIATKNVDQFLKNAIQLFVDSVLKYFKKNRRQDKNFIIHLIKNICEDIKNNPNKWIDNLLDYINLKSSKINKPQLIDRSNDSQITYNDDIELINIENLINYPVEYLDQFIQNTVNLNESNINKTENLFLEKVMYWKTQIAKNVTNEVESFVNKDTLVKDMTGILKDLDTLKHKDKTFEMLMKIGTKICLSVFRENLDQKKYVYILRCVWILININFSQSTLFSRKLSDLDGEFIFEMMTKMFNSETKYLENDVYKNIWKIVYDKKYL